MKGSRSVSEVVKPSSVLHYLAINQVPWIIRWDYGLRVDRARDKKRVFLVRNYYCWWKYDKSSKMVFLNKRLRTDQNMQGDRLYDTLPEWKPVRKIAKLRRHRRTLNHKPLKKKRRHEDSSSSESDEAIQDQIKNPIDGPS
ncbi:hypothetical protein FRX31_017402 [Thalictrum thalictroides]|uniref:Uncharacterized protein n=1 Tax=Thalictrum thalictroides TaxID=46969 RepID=A0A7J6W6Z8_THATH|nr:hypothetical protein FRX31_017402 [Thalictrum thalictroides]